MIKQEELQKIIDVSKENPELAKQLLKGAKYNKWQTEVLVYLFKRFNVVEKVAGKVEDEKTYKLSFNNTTPHHHSLYLSTTHNTSTTLYNDIFLYPYATTIMFNIAGIHCDFWYKSGESLFKTSFIFHYGEKIKNPLQTLHLQIIKQ